MIIKQRASIVIPLIIIINALVYFAWFHFGETSDFMTDHFLVSADALKDGRYWTLLTSVFSHAMFWHLLINMFVLNSFGSFLERFLGWKAFLTFYLVAGVVSSLGHVLASTYVLHTPELPALGASGAVAGLVLLFALTFPSQKILLFGIIPLPALWGALAFIALDIWGLTAQMHGGGLPIGHGAHLGGAFTGIVWYFLFMRRPRGAL